MRDFLCQIRDAQRAAAQVFGLKTVAEVAAADEPITLEDARLHLRVDVYGSPPESADDDWITDNGVPAAREYCERWLGRSLAPRTLELATNAFPVVAVDHTVGACFVLPFGPVQSVTSVIYTDSDGVEQTLDPATYELDDYANPTRLGLAYGATWPSARSSRNSVRVRYVAGYAATIESPLLPVLPRQARAAMLLMLGHLYENREATGTDKLLELPLGVQSLLELVPGRERLGMR